MDMPKWLMDSCFSERDKWRKHRQYTILRVLTLKGGLSMYRIEKELSEEFEKKGQKNKIYYTLILRDVSLFKRNNLISIKAGSRNAKICEVTPRGLITAWYQHYLSSEEFLESISKKSRVISILSQLPKLRKTAVERLVLKILPSIHRLWRSDAPELLKAQRIGGKQDSIEAKEDERYEQAWEEYYENLISTLEFDLLSVLIDNITKKDLSNFKKGELVLLKDRVSKVLKEWEFLLETSQQHFNKTQRLMDLLAS